MNDKENLTKLLRELEELDKKRSKLYADILSFKVKPKSTEPTSPTPPKFSLLTAVTVSIAFFILSWIIPTNLIIEPLIDVIGIHHWEAAILVFLIASICLGVIHFNKKSIYREELLRYQLELDQYKVAKNLHLQTLKEKSVLEKAYDDVDFAIIKKEIHYLRQFDQSAEYSWKAMKSMRSIHSSDPIVKRAAIIRRKVRPPHINLKSEVNAGESTSGLNHNSELHNSKQLVEVFCPNCGHKIVYEKNAAGKILGASSGAIGGAFMGSKVGLALGPLGAIAGTVPGAVIGGVFGGVLGNRVDTIRCASCDAGFKVSIRKNSYGKDPY